MPYCAIELGRALERVGLLAERLARRRRAGGSGPADGCASNSPLQVTERSPRMFSVSSAFSWPAFGMPTRMPNCCCTLGSEIVGSMRPSSNGSPVYSLEVRKDASRPARSAVGNVSGAPARTAPVAGGIGVPSAVTSAVQVPL